MFIPMTKQEMQERNNNRKYWCIGEKKFLDI